jgi:hypothetical protein
LARPRDRFLRFIITRGAVAFLRQTQCLISCCLHLKSSPTGKFERKSCEELIKTCLLCAQRPRVQFRDPFVLADIVAMGWDTRGDIFVHNMGAVPHFYYHNPQIYFTIFWSGTLCRYFVVSALVQYRNECSDAVQMSLTFFSFGLNFSKRHSMKKSRSSAVVVRNYIYVFSQNDSFVLFIRCELKTIDRHYGNHFSICFTKSKWRFHKNFLKRNITYSTRKNYGVFTSRFSAFSYRIMYNFLNYKKSIHVQQSVS